MTVKTAPKHIKDKKTYNFLYIPFKYNFTKIFNLLEYFDKDSNRDNPWTTVIKNKYLNDYKVQ